jgi:hypothetical protein
MGLAVGGGVLVLAGAGALVSSRVVAALTLGAVLLTLVGCAGEPDGARSSRTSSASRIDPSEYAAQIVRETNDVRAARSLPGLGGSKCARDAALARALDLIGHGQLTHRPLPA